MKAKKLLAILLTAVMLASALCITPLTASAEAGTEAPSKSAAALATSPIAIDGVVDEFWNTVEPNMYMTTWVSGNSSTATVEHYTVGALEESGASYTIKIANDSHYVYVLYEASVAIGDTVGFQIGFNGATGNSGNLGEWIYFEMKQDVQNGNRSTANIRNFRSSFGTSYENTSYVWQGVLAGNTYTTKESGSGAFEVRFPIPESVRDQLRDGNVDITFTAGTKSKYAATGETRPSSAAWDCGMWLPGFSTNGTFYLNGETPNTVTLQQADSGRVENVLGNLMEVDGVMGEGEGWSEKPYALLDTLDNSGYNLTGVPTATKASDVPTVRISTDGEKLYFFFELTGDILLSTSRTNIISVFADFTRHGGDMYGMEMYLSSLEGEFVCGVDGHSTGKGATPFRNFYLNGTNDNTTDNKLRTETAVANKIVDEKRHYEISMPIPENMQAQFTKNGLDCGIGVYVRDNNPANNNGYSTPNLQMTMPGTTVGTTVLPNVNEARPTLAGVQYRKYTSETDASKTLVDIRFAATLKDAALAAGTSNECVFKEVGFDITNEENTKTFNTYNIYKSLVTPTVPELPSNYGDGDFFFCYAFYELDVDATYTFDVRCWTLKEGGVRVYSAKAYQAVVAIDANGVATINFPRCSE